MSFGSNISYGRVVINWKLMNFSKDLLDAENFPSFPVIYSPEFQVYVGYESTKWKLQATRNGSILYLSIKKVQDLVRRSNGYVIKYFFQIKDQYHDKYVKRSQGSIEIDEYERKLGKIISFKECNRPYSFKLLLNSSITICVYFEIIRRNTDISRLLNTTLSSHYEKMFNNENYSDFLITSVDDQEIHVHRNILSMRSPVFDAMINSAMKEGNEKRVKIDDIDGRTLTELMRFIYSGKVYEIETIASELLYAANKYDICDLKPLCVEALALNISSENVLEIFALADLHQEKHLKKFCIDFIRWRYEEVKESPGWENLNHQAMKEILDFVMSSCCKREENLIITSIKRTQTVNPSRLNN